MRINLQSKTLTILAFYLICQETLQTATQANISPPVDYKFIYYADFMKLVDKLQAHPLYDRYMRITEGFSHYNINPTPYCGNESCKNPIIEIADFTKGPEFVNSLPVVLLVAGFHGDEVVGTNSLYRMIELFCDNFFKQKLWSNLIGNVRIMMLPMANVNGFYHQKREETVLLNENSTEFDPNRDFPYDPDKKQGCFETSTAELLDAIFRDNIIVGCLTFHGGANSITYPWGNIPHLNRAESGDQVAFDAVANVLTQVAGGNTNFEIKPYEIGTLEEVVYVVHGGFEDWGYGASFDTKYIDKKCSKRENRKFGLVSDNLSYNDISNRAFLYLVEAGPEKIPNQEHLGNKLPLESDDYSKGIWGHVPRNINLSTRFSQVIGPFSSVDKIKYEEGHLLVDLLIYGCRTIDHISSNDLNLEEKSREYDERRNIWKMSLKSKLSPGLHKQVSLEISCDQNWAKPTHDQLPQSHLVRRRTDPNYSVDYKQFKLRSNKNLIIGLKNLRTNLLDSVLFNYEGKSQYSLIYNPILKSSRDFSLNKNKNEGVNITFKDNHLHVVSSSGALRRIRIHSHSNSVLPNASCTKAPRMLMELKTNEQVPMTEHHFTALVGRAFEVLEENSETPIYSSVLNLDVNSPEEEDINAMSIPAQGLSCHTPSLAHPNKLNFFTIVHSEANNELEVTFYSHGDQASDFKSGSLSGHFKESSEANGVSKYVGIIQVKDSDHLRLLGRIIQGLNANGHAVSSCNLGLWDQSMNINEILNVDLLKGQSKNEMSPLWKFVIALVIIVGMLVVAFFTRRALKKHQVKEEDKVTSFSVTSFV
jgi:hypothetical protein